ncbi:putative disease resistance protein RGA4 [Lolium rigidum]|uniref:putative disease resistance protein RGA4 n=1 Tax=Lolium rigidum TaxID=89674 RepID=UPI001F5CCB0D|nr:putative disease resistance protein RGA4 [Lolium rigidum]
MHIPETNAWDALEDGNDLTRLKTLVVRSVPGLKCLQLHSCTALEELTINCESLVQLEGLQSLGSLERLELIYTPGLESLQLHSCTALEELRIRRCRSLTALEGLQSLGRLKKLVVEWSPGLESLQLHSCTALEELTITYCGPLIQPEGLQYLGRLRHLAVYGCPDLGPCLELFPQLEKLETDNPSVLTMSFCYHHTTLRRLKLYHLVLSEEQGRALVLLTSLQELEFNDCPSLLDLPAGLHLLPSLKRLKISYCQRISRLPETGLPLSLEELEISYCSKELDDQWKGLATSKLRVTIKECW